MDTNKPNRETRKDEILKIVEKIKLLFTIFVGVLVVYPFYIMYHIFLRLFADGNNIYILILAAVVIIVFLYYTQCLFDSVD